jgi:hypothetical protein
MTRTHDLEGILGEVLAHFAPLPPIRISWVDADAFLDTRDLLGQAVWTKDGRFVGVSTRLRRAPRYVVAYAVFHEVLHFALLPRDSRSETWRKGEPYRVTWHHRAFCVAERLWPTYVRANAWIAEHI